jgi:hypothetical protein
MLILVCAKCYVLEIKNIGDMTKFPELPEKTLVCTQNEFFTIIMGLCDFMSCQIMLCHVWHITSCGVMCDTSRYVRHFVPFSVPLLRICVATFAHVIKCHVISSNGYGFICYAESCNIMSSNSNSKSCHLTISITT